MSAAGYSLLSIARQLNVDGVPVLRPSRKNRKKGWVASTIRAILHNPIYVGQRTYGKREWHRDPDTGKRRSRDRTEGVLTLDQPELRIVDPAVWEAVRERQAAVRAKYATKGAPVAAPRQGTKPGRATKYPFSGLLFCASCDTPMVICGGTPHRYYRCGDVHKRGICENRLLVRESHVRRALLAAVQESITSPWAVHYVRKRWAETIGESVRQAERDLRSARSRFARCEARLKAFAEMWADGERGGEVRAAWDDAKLEVQTLRATVSALEGASAAPIHLPSPAEVEDRILSLHRLVECAPVEAREVLGAIFGEGRIVMIPQADRSYLAKTEILPLVLIAPSTRNPRSGEPGGGLVYSTCCAGAIHSIYTAVRIPVEVRIAA
jgi:hypothetical protein